MSEAPFLGEQLISTGVGAWRLNGQRYRRRLAALEQAVLETTQALEYERLRERGRNQILDLLASNKPLGSVLDAVVALFQSESPDCLCAIVMKRGSGCDVAAAPDFPRDWLLALRSLQWVPSEVWCTCCESERPHQRPPWQPFAAAGDGGAPAVIRSLPIGNTGEAPGALLLFYREQGRSRESEAPLAELACQLVRLALEHSRLYDDLHFQTDHDALTGLANRRLYDERLRRSLSEAEARGRKLAVVLLDLDHSRQINDTFTHKAGDLILAEISKRMKDLLRPRDTLARIGGDEFIAILDDAEDSVEAAGVASRMLERIREPLAVDGEQVEVTASAGVAIFPDDARTPEQLERAAEAAMYDAKELGRNRVQIFATRNETLDRARMEEQLRLGLRRNWFVVYYQPKVRADRKIVGFEALVRLNHPEYGMIPPAEFVPIAEANGLIVPLGYWVLEDVCRQISAWEALGLGQIPVAVNVSPVQICRPDFASAVEQCLSRHGILPANIELELTEGMLISAAGVAQEQLQALRALGIQLSIDDFGTGYASLSYLHRLQFDSIKLDRSFVQSIDTDDLARRLIEAMIGVAQGLGLNVVAEGVETESQRIALLGAGCPLMQGFLFARPRPAAEVEDLIRLSEGTSSCGSENMRSGEPRQSDESGGIANEPFTALTPA